MSILSNTLFAILTLVILVAAAFNLIVALQVRDKLATILIKVDAFADSIDKSATSLKQVEGAVLEYAGAFCDSFAQSNAIATKLSVPKQVGLPSNC